VIPAYEEAEALPGLLRRIPDAVWCGIPVAALVVDDGSRDGTAGVARANGARVVSHATNLGGGAALATGFALAVAEGARAVVTMDADGQHLPEEMPALLEPVLDGRAGLAVGSRALGSADPNAFARELGIAVFNRLISVLTGSRITDCSNGYRAMRTDVIPQLDLRQRQFHTSEFLIQAIARGIEVVEVPVTVVARTHGATKKPRALRYGFGFARAIIGTWARTLPLRVAARSRRSARTRPAR
jgi:glycosyltransferase involved in cell wall biosynthesis